MHSLTLLLFIMACLFHTSSLWGKEVMINHEDSIQGSHSEELIIQEGMVPDWSLVFADCDEEEWMDVQDVLTTMALNRQNINEMSIDELRMVPMISDDQALAIIHYRTLYGDLRSMAELSLITALDRPRQQLLSAIFYAAPTQDNGRYAIITPSDSISRSWRHTKRKESGRLLFTLSIPTYERQGERDGTYRGPGLNHSLRFTYAGRRYQVALTAAQDAGEPFFAGTNAKGWDFYTGYVRLKQLGIISNVVAGHYQMQMGMGLLLNNNWRLSRSSMLVSSPSASTVLRGHSSRTESNYLQGVAATLALPGKVWGGKMGMTAFVSHRWLDATMSATTPATVTTILTTGYHRTESEIARRATTTQTAAGMALEYWRAPLRLSLNMIHVAMGDSLLPDKRQKYRMFHPTGKRFSAASLSYSLTMPRLTVSGETAVSEGAKKEDGTNGGAALATLNSLRWKVSNQWTAFAVQRFYSYRFVSLLGKSFGDVSNVQDETGVYAGITTTAINHLSLSAYVDCAYHPWYRYGWNGSSRSWDSYLMATLTYGKTKWTMRYRYREQALSADGMAWPSFGSTQQSTLQHSLRGTLKTECGRLTLTSQVHATYLPSSADSGWMLSQAVGYGKGWLSTWFSATYFDTSSYASRLYLTDHSLTYGSLTSMMYGRGMRINVIAQASLSKSLSLAMRCNMLHYFDRDVIGSAYQRIDSSNQTDIQLQATWKF